MSHIVVDDLIVISGEISIAIGIWRLMNVHGGKRLLVRLLTRRNRRTW